SIPTNQHPPFPPTPLTTPSTRHQTMPFAPAEIHLLSNLEIQLTQAESVLSTAGLKILATTPQLENILTKIADVSPGLASCLLREPSDVIKDHIECRAIAARKKAREDKRMAREEYRRRKAEVGGTGESEKEKEVKNDSEEPIIAQEQKGRQKRRKEIDGGGDEDESGGESEPVTKRLRLRCTKGQKKTAKSSATAPCATDITTRPVGGNDVQQDSHAREPDDGHDLETGGYDAGDRSLGLQPRRRSTRIARKNISLSNPINWGFLAYSSSSSTEADSWTESDDA
ncbi:MAG: hypothetical protein L6R35_003325, partial [Caloplaca aegaea]